MDSDIDKCHKPMSVNTYLLTFTCNIQTLFLCRTICKGQTNSNNLWPIQVLLYMYILTKIHVIKVVYNDILKCTRHTSMPFERDSNYLNYNLLKCQNISQEKCAKNISQKKVSRIGGCPNNNFCPYTNFYSINICH